MYHCLISSVSTPIGEDSVWLCTYFIVSLRVSFCLGQCVLSVVICLKTEQRLCSAALWRHQAVSWGVSAAWKCLLCSAETPLGAQRGLTGQEIKHFWNAFRWISCNFWVCKDMKNAYFKIHHDAKNTQTKNIFFLNVDWHSFYLCNCIGIFNYWKISIIIIIFGQHWNHDYLKWLFTNFCSTGTLSS